MYFVFFQLGAFPTYLMRNSWILSRLDWSQKFLDLALYKLSSKSRGFGLELKWPKKSRVFGVEH